MNLSPAIGTTLALLAFSGVLGAQTVYRCTSPAGVAIFSSEPCGKDAKATHYRTMSPDEEASLNDANCRRAADDLDARPDNSRIEAARAEMEALSRVSHRGTPAENEVWKRDAQARMDSLRESVRQGEERNAQQSVEMASRKRKAIADCDKRKADQQPAREGGG